ncbi:MAG: IS66 family insertion sequence element accessory protein TnpB [Porticoccus sp.]|jgi:transposase|nr:IS66 family insertion sequence element accessory protein TnpB [Porticoccus sp.]
MIHVDQHTQVFLAAGITDMRKSINGLSILTEEVLMHNPLSSHLFVFCNRQRDKLKILYWHNNGFWLFYRRLEKQRFHWPQPAQSAAIEITSRELLWLLEGLDISHVTAHQRLDYSAI